ncbi:hypothetical protein EYZ11_004568 [Aspergillus tanneri]|uniref:Succinyl-diaminopimelate desuccinylase n=1 Tax=Aspergillus tanneri TaxID=1220188 RepID=A0A4S3JR50_9EURO|nr:hypothetical protein EYZ11_004568 [Aspergillus tanneri]
MAARRPIYFNSAAANTHCDSLQVDGLEAFHQSLPDYAPTLLIPLPELAHELGVRAVFVKDESNRLGLPAFKVLGASWGCYRAIAQHLGLSSTVGVKGLLSALQGEKKITLFAATEGNHGRAVAFIAQWLGIQARIFVPQHMVDSTQALIGSEGASVTVVHGDYDQAVQEAADAARITEGGILIQDTAFKGYEEVPSWIVEGYSTMMTEIEEQLAHQSLRCSLMMVPVGVGSLAHAVIRYGKSREPPISVVAVEPDTAPSLYSSLQAGQETTRCVDACITVSSYETHCALQYLSARSVAAGPCGGASLAALRRLSADKTGSLLDKDSVLVLLGTEGPRPYTPPMDVSVDDPVELTQVLTRINSSNPSLTMTDGAGEVGIADYLAAWFAHRDIEYHRLETVSGRPSIVGVLRGAGGGRSLMFNGHVDTVSLASYGKDPLSGALGEKNGRQVVLGRGSLDMKGGLAAALASVSAIKATGKIPRGDVIVAAVSDEEDASRGTRDLLAAGWRADAAVVPEPTMGKIVTAHKGFLWVEVDILGVAAHGSDPVKGVDAILSTSWFFRALEQYQQQLPVDDTLGSASLHCGLIRGGEEPSSYPATCTVTVEFRTIPCQSDESILSDVSTMLESVARENPLFRFAEPRITMSRPTQKLAVEHPLVKQALACAETVLGSRPKLGIVPFWCDAALLDEVGIPAIVLGPKGEGLHSKEEWVEVESIRQHERIYTKLIEVLCR